MNQLALELQGPRLSRQCGKILALLGSWKVVSNRELAALALNYRARISDLRHLGYDIRVVDRDHRTGLVDYSLFVDGQPARGPVV